ncbi:MAG: glycosyltransferase [Treponema sp.]|nr:glycosyltransferase [Treponema sp.]
MTIQKILFPSKELCNEHEMYFRGVEKSAVKSDGGIVFLKQGEALSLDTYFNSFPVGTWKRYTRLEALQFCFCAECECTVRIFHATAQADYKRVSALRQDENFKFDIDGTSAKIKEAIHVSKREIACKTETTSRDRKTFHSVRISQLPGDGIMYATITTERDTPLEKMRYETEVGSTKPNDIKIAVGICTFRREEALMRNVEKINREIIGNGSSPLHDKLEVYISDNGKTIPSNAFSSDKIHLFPNVNLGGSAGFSRTMIESIFHDSEKDFSHIILMDDDIVLSTDTLERTYQFLSFLKDDFKDSMLGSAMFHDDRRYCQRENGTLFDGTFHFKAMGRFFDMREKEFVALNTNRANVNYQGWWYCCIPSRVVKKRNLPIPFFIHYDDIEYGIRNSQHELILVNGICVWHPQFINKDPVWITYYNSRNFLVVSALYDYNSALKIGYFLTRLFLWYVLSYRYEDSFLLRKGIDDFLKGAEHFKCQDAVKLHETVLAHKYKRQTPEELGIDLSGTAVAVCSTKLISSLVRQLFCTLLPLSKKIRVFDFARCNFMFNARRCYVYDSANKSGVLYERCIKSFFRESFLFLKSIFCLILTFSKTKKQFKKNMNDFTSVSFWEKYLQI